MPRAQPPNRRQHIAFNFQHDGQRYHCSASHFSNGQLAEIFLTTNKAGSAAQQHAECAAILCSLALQYGASVEEIRHSISGPIAVARELARAS